MNKSLKDKKRILTVMLALAIVMLVITNLLHGLARLLAWILTVACLAMLILLWVKLWRCPHCNAHLGRPGDLGKQCPHCGKPLE